MTIVPAEDCYISALSYSNGDSAFAFNYDSAPSGYVNKVELPMYLRDPLLTNDQKTYTRSDGSIKKIYERKEEMYILETDTVPYTWLKNLDVALSHTNVIIVNDNADAVDPVNTATQFVKQDDMEIQYISGGYTNFGKATVKLVNAAPVNLINNNCS
jgi:hypothetical protein